MSDQSESSGGRSKDREPPFAEASIWMSRVTTMIAPGIAGIWADRKFGTSYLALAGFLLGLTFGVIQIVIGQQKKLSTSRKSRPEESESGSEKRQ